MIKFYDGSKVETEHPRQALYAFLIAAIDSTGKPIYPVKADWFYTPTSWQALDEAQKDFGNCHVAKSAVYADLISHCANNQ